MMLKFRVRSSGTAACLSALASVVDGEAHARDVAEKEAENCGGVNHRGGAMRSTSALVVARAARLSAMCQKRGEVCGGFGFAAMDDCRFERREGLRPVSCWIRTA